jgi:outer membrane protein
MMMKPKLLTLLLGAACAAPVFAENLSEVYGAALAYDASYAAAQAAYRASQEKTPQALAGLLPSASLNANARYNDVEGSFTSSEFNSNSWNVSAAQPIYRGQNLIAYDQAKISVQAAENQLKTAGQDLILRTARAYFDVLLAQDNLEFTRSQKAAITEQLAAAKRNFEVGTATITDTHEAQARFDLTVSQEIAALNLLATRRYALHKLTGKHLNTLATLKANPALVTPAPANMDEWVDRSQNENLQVRIRQQYKQIADQEIDRMRAGHHPTLDLIASYTDSRNQNFGAGTIDSKSTLVGLEFALPLYQGGLVSSQVREAVANQEKARQELEDALRSAALQTREAYLDVTSSEAQVKALEAALASTQKSLESTQLGLEVGVRTNVDVLNAQQQLTSAQRELAVAHYRFLMSVLNLKAAAGTLTAADLGEIDKLLTAAKSASAENADPAAQVKSAGLKLRGSPVMSQRKQFP